MAQQTAPIVEESTASYKNQRVNRAATAEKRAEASLGKNGAAKL